MGERPKSALMGMGMTGFLRVSGVLKHCLVGRTRELQENIGRKSVQKSGRDEAAAV
jgi:hypothetical protein